jgi:A/G-specific adenine glycosylase
MMQFNRNHESLPLLRNSVLEWYDCNRRDLPWRTTCDPYAIWVSEIMLQQTRVAVVIERYKSFLERFPTVLELANASEQDVLALWSGLGYYRRARMLHQAAQIVSTELGGCVPVSAVELRKLPGIGAYTAAAIASIAYGERIAAVDGNVERVISRLRGWESADLAGEAAIRRKVEGFAGELIDTSRPGDFNQALMELGATVCTPRNPQCLNCPWTAECVTRGEHQTPRRPSMTRREVACALIVRRSDSASPKILLEQRSASESVMANMWQLPFLRNSHVPECELRMTVRHAIMQVNYVVHVRDVAEDKLNALVDHVDHRRWVAPAKAEKMALTGLTRKVLTRASLLPVASRTALSANPSAK